MSFRYTSMSEEECQREKGFALAKPGIYKFEVITANYKVSKSGNPMIELKLRFWDDQGKDHLLFEYLVATPQMMWKTRHFCDAVGLTKEFDGGRFNESLCIGRCGKASITVIEGKKKPDGTFYNDKNGVVDYVMTAKGALKYHAPETNDRFEKVEDDDIPF